jgi:hypothetical protein
LIKLEKQVIGELEQFITNFKVIKTVLAKTLTLDRLVLEKMKSVLQIQLKVSFVQNTFFLILQQKEVEVIQQPHLQFREKFQKTILAFPEPIRQVVLVFPPVLSDLALISQLVHF